MKLPFFWSSASVQVERKAGVSSAGCAATDSGAARSLTARAILAGLVAGAVIAAGGYINDSVLGLTPLVGSHLPICVYGPLILAALFIGPVLKRINPALAFRGGELAVTVAIMLASASVATNGLFRFFTPVLVMPAQHYRTQAGWQDNEILQYIPPNVIVADGHYDEDAIGGFLQGLAPLHGNISFGDIPWNAWCGPLTTWLPILLGALLAGLSLAMLVHRQWSQREHLAFPIVEFANTIISCRCRGDDKSLFASSGFWWALAIVFGIHMVNGYAVWEPGMIDIPLRFEAAAALVNTFPGLARCWDFWYVFNPKLFFAVVGFSFFVSRDVSLALGIVGPLHTVSISMLMAWGINLHAGPGSGNYLDFLRLGASLGLAAALAYHGRAYYGAAFAKAFGFRRGRPTEGAWPARLLLLSSALMVALLARMGLDWPVAIMAIMLLLLVNLVMMRISAETGMFFLQSGFVMPGIIGATFGHYALGPKATFLSRMFGYLAASDDAKVTVSALAVHGLELSDRRGVRTRPLAGWMMVMIVLAIAIALPVILYVSYNHGLPATDTWALNYAGRMPATWLDQNVTLLKSTGQLASSVALTPWQRLTSIAPMKGLLLGVGVGLGLTLLLSTMRLRFARWPIHPLIVVVFGIYPVAEFGGSFLAGWFLRMIVERLGGMRATVKARPIMVGLIAGEILAALFWVLVGLAHYAVWGTAGPVYRVFP